MSASALDNFCENLAESNLLDHEQLAAVVLDARESDARADQLAGRLVDQGILTAWQAGMLLQGQKAFFLGRYKLIDHLGQGGMGAVFKAEQAPMGRIVAVKTMAKHLVKKKEAVARFYQEIRAAAALDHPNIVMAYDAGSVRNMHFLVMECVEGISLSDLAKSRERLPVGDACEYIRQAAVGLQHAHERGMVHRDIKPGNLLLSRRNDGTTLVKILDMGLAKFQSEAGSDGELTTTGEVMGTPDYIAPEQARSTKNSDIRSDIFSLGCTLFRLIAGQPPFDGNNAIEKIMARALEDAPPIRRFAPEVSAELEAVIARMLARKPQDRFQAPIEVAAALSPFAEESHEEETVIISSADLSSPADYQAPTMLQSRSLHEEDDADEEYVDFLNLLATEAADDEEPTLSTLNLGEAEAGGATISAEDQVPAKRTRRTRAGRKLHKQLKTRHRQERRRAVLTAIGLTAFIALVSAYVWYDRAGRTHLLIDWPTDERQGAMLEVNGREVLLAATATIDVVGREGKTTLRLVRKGHKPIDRTWNLTRGQTVPFRPEWTPTVATIRHSELQALADRLENLIKDYSQGSIKFDDAPFLALHGDLRDFQSRHIQSEDAATAALLVGRLPSAFDQLNVADLPETDPPVTKGTPLVGVFGSHDLRLQHWNPIAHFSFSADGKRLASMGRYEHSTRIWDTKTGEFVKDVPGALGTFSPDGTFIATTFAGGIQLWDAESFEKGRLLPELKAPFVISVDGKRLAAVNTAADTLVVLDPDTGRGLSEMKQSQGPIVHLVFSPDGSMLVSSVAGTGSVVVWETSTGQNIAELAGYTGESLDPVRAVFSPDGKRLIGTLSYQVIAWDTTDWTKIVQKQYPGQRGVPRFFAEGDMLIAPTGGGFAILDGKTLEIRSSHGPRGVGLVAVSPDGSLAALGSSTIKLWDLAKQQQVVKREGPTGTAVSVAIGPDGRHLATTHGDGTVRIWDVARREVLHRLQQPSLFPHRLVFSPKGDSVAAAIKSGILIWNYKSDKHRTIQQHESINVYGIDYSPDGKTIAAGGQGRIVRLWDVATGKQLKSTKVADTIHCLSFSPDGKKIAIAVFPPGVVIYEPATGKQTPVRLIDFPVHAIDYSPNGRTLAVSGGERVTLIDLDTDELIGRLEGNYGRVTFSPADGQLAALAGGLIRRLDPNLVSATKTIQFSSPRLWTHDLDYAPDGRHLVTANGNGTVYVLRLKKWTASGDPDKKKETELEKRARERARSGKTFGQ